MKFSTSLPKTYPAPFQNQNPFNMKLSYPSSVNTNHLPTRSAPWWRTFLLVGTILLGALSLIPSTAVAQTVTIGAGTLTQRYPLGSFYGYERSAALYTTTEMSAVAGSNITTVSWYCTVTGPARPVVIYLKTGTASPLTAIPWSTMITGATQVYTGSFTPVANTWNTFTLSAPFNYAGQNLVVMVESNIGGGGAGGSAAPSVQYTASTGNHALVVADNSPPTGNLAVTASRPNIQLGYSGGAPCAGIPAPGNTTGPASTLSGSTINLGLQNVTTGSGVTYQWEQNINGGGWGNAPSTSSTYSPSPTQNTQYRCIVTCASNSTTSNVLSVAVVASQNVPFTGFSTVACGTDLVLLDHAGNGNYSSNANGYTVLDAGAEGVISISGTYDTESNYDYIRIYSGTGTGGTLLNTYTGPGSVNYVGLPGQTLTVQFTSDGSVEYTGFQLNVSYTGACFSNACSGTPAPGNTISSTASACSGANFTLSLQNTTIGSGVTYQWQSADDVNFTVNVTALGTASTQITSQTSAKYYRATVTCAASSGVSTPILVGVETGCQCLPYCVVSNNGDGACINTVQINTLNSTSAACVPNPGYTLKSETTTLTQGSTYPITVTTFNDGIYGGAIVSVWFDWNNNGTFEASEWFQPNTTGFTGTINVPVPLNATLGTIRMRVRSRGTGNINGAGDGCLGSMGSGTAEDFCITIAASSPCTGVPAPGNTTGPTTTFSGSQINLSLQTVTVGSGVTYQWEENINGGGWGNAPSTNPTYSPSPTQNTQYRCIVTCGANSTTSNVLAVSVLQSQLVPFTGSNTVACGTDVVLLDHAGTGDYANYADGYTVLDAGNAGIITISGTRVMETCCDHLYIYSGSGIGGTVYLDVNSSGAVNYVGNPGETLTVRFTSDVSGTFSGFELNVSYSGSCAGAPCAGTPVPGSPASTVASGCGSVTTATLSLPNLPFENNYSYQWQSSTTGGAPWTNIGTDAREITVTNVTATTTYQCVVTCTNGPATTTSGTVVITIYTTPTVSPTAGTICSGQDLQLTGTTSGGGGTTFAWTGPNGFTSTQQNPVITGATPAAGGTYSLVATENGCASAPGTTNAVVNVAPTITATASAIPDQICAGGSTQLSVSATVPGYSVATAFYAPVSGSGTAGPSGDDATLSVPIGFPFTFYGAAYTNAVISTNGFISFDAGSGNGCCSGQLLPDVNTPNNLVALAWNDLTAAAGQITYFNLTSPNRFVVNFNAVPHLGGGGTPITAQIILYTDGTIEMHNTSGASDGSNQTQGLENATGTSAIAAPGRNGTVWTATNDAYRFTPNAPTYLWDNAGLLNDPTLANPVASNVVVQTNFTVTASIGGCSVPSSVTVLVDPPPAATAAVVPDCGNNQFSVSVDITSTGTASTAGVSWTVNGVPGAGSPITGLPVGQLVPDLGPFAATDEVEVTLLHESNSACNQVLGTYYSGCAIVLSCGSTTSDSHCYRNNETRTYFYVTPVSGETITLNFSQGTIGLNDAVNIYDGANSSYPSLGGGNFGGNIGGASFVSSGDSIFFKILSNDTTSCADGAFLNNPIAWTVQCTPGCLQPDAFASPLVDCANGNFSIDVFPYSSGDGSTGDVNIYYQVSPAAPDTLLNVPIFTSTVLGPYPLGTVVNVTIGHSDSTACNKILTPITVSVSACPNDEPCQARSAPVNPNYTCAQVVPGALGTATATPGITNNCGGIPNRDLWYRFVTTAVVHRVQLQNVFPGTTAMTLAAFRGTCAAPVPLDFGCSTTGTLNLVGLTIGETILVRAYNTNGNAVSSTFNFCVSAPPASFNGQNALSFDGTNDRVECGTAPSVSITGTALTLEAWIYPTSFRANSFEGSIINKEGPNVGYALRCGGAGQLSFAVGSGSTIIEVLSATNALTLNTWQHVAATYDGINKLIFVNGVQVGTSAGPASLGNSTNQLMIGDYGAGVGTRNFPGKIDEVRIWNTVLSPANIAANQNQQFCGGEAGLAAYYQFNQGTDSGVNNGLTTLFDISGNANNGTLNNFALVGPTSNWVQGKTGMTPCAPCSAPPTPGTITGTSPVCSNVAHSLNIQGQTTGTGITYQWYYGPVGNPTLNMLGTSLGQPTAAIPAGTWQLVVDVTCTSFGTTQTPVFSFVKNTAPTAVPSFALPSCVGGTLNLLGTTDVGTTFSWTGPGGFTSTEQNPSRANATLAMSGLYSFTSTLATCSSSGTVSVTVGVTPVITSISATPNPICENSATSQLQVLAPASGFTVAAITHAPVTGTNIPAPSQSDDGVSLNIPIGFTFPFYGNSYTTLNISCNGFVSFTSTGSGCCSGELIPFAGGAFAIDNTIALAWDDLNVANGGSISYFNLTSPNRFVVSFNAVPFYVNGPGLVTGQIIIYQTGVIEIHSTGIDATGQAATQGVENANGTLAEAVPGRNSASWTATNDAYRFTPNSYAISWSPSGNLSNASISNPVFGPVSAGSYPLVATATNPVTGCFATEPITIVANPALIAGQANITPAVASVCGAVPVVLTANPTGGGGPYNYAWTNPNAVAAGTNQTQSAAIAGTWSVLITDACGGQATATRNVQVNPAPTASATASPACDGSDFTLTGTTDIGTTYSWTGPNGFTSTSQSPTVTGASAASAGVYTFTTTSIANCTSSGNVSVTVNPSPIITSVTATPSSVCAGGNAQLNVLVPGPSAYCASSIGSVTYEYVANVTYAGINNTTGGIAGGPVDYTAQVANVTAGGTNALSVTAFVDGSDYIYAWIDWNKNGVLNDAGETYILASSVSSPGPYTVNVTVPVGAINGPTRMRVMLEWLSSGPNPCVTASYGEAEDYTVNVTGGASAVSYSWSPATYLNSTTIANPTVTAAMATTPYTVTVTGGNGCSSSGSVTLNVTPPPTVNAGNYGPACGLDAADIALNGGSPVGGTFSGTGVSGPVGSQVFDPGVGTQTILYTSSGTCPGTANTTITVNTTDTDLDGVPDCADNCPNVSGQIGSGCDSDPGPGVAPGVLDANCNCVLVGCTENFVVDLRTDANSDEASFEIFVEGTSSVVCQGGIFPPYPGGITSPIVANCCLPVGCYKLNVYDSGGDGFVNGGYQVRESGSGGRRIIDNFNNFSSGSLSSVSGPQSFCLPMGNVDLINHSCDKLDWVQYKYLVSHADPLVAAEWVPNGANSVQDANSGYEFWIFDPNGTYSFRRFHAHNVSDGFSPASANRAARLKIHGWYNTVLTPHIPEGVLMNVRVRGRVNGVNQAFGPACRMKMDATRAACPMIWLQDDNTNTSDYSCGVKRSFGGTNSLANRIVAKPPQFEPAPLAGGTSLKFQFRFRIPGEQVCIVLPPRNSAELYMTWTSATAPPLECTKTYEVDVRVSKDGGATWCVDSPSPACYPAQIVEWGRMCTVTIDCQTAQGGGASSMGTQNGGALTMYPNPNRGDLVTIALSEVGADVRTVSVDIYDLRGQRVTARTIAVQDGYLNTVIDLQGDMAGGMYMVNITAGDKTYTERLVIQP